MSTALSTNENCDKYLSILTAARKRLGIYGYEKTTMQEIADDAGLSKASLYYYFPDKEHLIKAVIENEQASFIKNLEISLEGVINIEDQLKTYILQRHEFFRNLLNLNKMRFSEYQKLKPFLRDTFKSFRVKEAALLKKLLFAAQQSGYFHIDHIDQTITLLLDTLHGLRFVVVQGTEFISLTEEDYQIILEKHMLFLELFIKGLRYQSISNQK